MKWMILFAVLLCCDTAFSADRFLQNSKNVKWQTNTTIAPGVSLRYVHLISIDQVQSFRMAYRDINISFEEFMKIETSNCDRRLEIRIVPLNVLGSPKYFPGEAEYSDEKGNITGRYFRNTNVMYLVPRRHYYNWKRTFAHELAHHLFDACGTSFVNDYVEHHIIRAFEKGI